MALEIRYRTQGARTNLPSPFRTIAIRARRVGAGRESLGSTVRLLAHIHCPRFLEYQKRRLPVEGNRREAAFPRAGGPAHRSRPTARSEWRDQPARCGCENRPLEPGTAKGT